MQALFSDLAPRMSQGFVHQELELIKLNVCVTQILCQEREKGEIVVDELL